MKEQIQEELYRLEVDHDIKVLYGCESGSRAWGFESKDSDYDVRFIYIHPPDWYLSVNLESKRDVIEIPIDEELDINGWDIRKALKLFYKSNPPLLEWLGSPIHYLQQSSFVLQLRDLRETYYKPISCMYHYQHMAQGNYRDYLKGERVWLKKYFYVLRPILAIKWLENDYGVVPTEFEKLVERMVIDPALKKQIDLLVEKKKAGQELDYGSRIPEISDFIIQELARLENEQFNNQLEKLPFEPLNELFRSTLTEVWG